MAIGDLNADGFLDVVVASSGGKPNELLLGDGAGAFTALSTFPGGASSNSAVALADVNSGSVVPIISP